MELVDLMKKIGNNEIPHFLILFGEEQKILESHQLSREIKELNIQIENSDSLEFIEKIAREDLEMVKPREIIYIDKEKKDKSVFKDD